MALPEFTIRDLLSGGFHFGHLQNHYNPKMEPYIYGVRKNVSIMDLSQTAPMLYHALEVVSDTVANGGRLLMVGTKRQAKAAVLEAANKSAMHYVNSRWLGGTLTNWRTVSKSIQTLIDLDEKLNDDSATGLTKREILNLTRKRDKLDRDLRGLSTMGGVPDLLIVIDTNREYIAIKEANKLGIPVLALIDSNCNPDNITHLVPGNDDSIKSVTLFCNLMADAALDGLSRMAEELPDEDEFEPKTEFERELQESLSNSKNEVKSD